jgi:SNF2 family DNA or RNA helicase
LATDTRHGLVAPERLKTLVSESVWERGGQLVNAGAITVQRSATKLGGTVADKGYMPLWVEVTLPVGATTVPVCKRCGPSWCLHAVALLLKAWEKADPDAPAKLPVLIPPLPPAETPAVKGSPVPVAGPMVGDWWARFLEDGPGWFQLSLGVEIDGLEVDLVPIFQAILREKSLDILRAWSLTQRPYPVKLPDGRVAGIPADRMARIVQALETVLEAKGKPRMSRIDAAFLPDLGIPETAWGRPESLDGFRRNLRDPGTIEPLDEPSGLLATLRPYQKLGLGWLRFLADLGLGGVLADDMGLGKTVQTLAHLLDEKARGRMTNPVLIVCPTSLVANWSREAARLAPSLRVAIHHGPERGGKALATSADLVVTTYPLLVRDEALIAGRDWSLAVFDEAHVLKNPRARVVLSARRLRTARRVALTGTPMENHLEELWCLLDLVVPGILGTRGRFNESWRKPVETRGDTVRAGELGRRIAPFVLRRTKWQVASELPAKTEIVQMVELDGFQRDLYESVRAAADRKVLSEIERVGLEKSGMVVLESLLRLRQICCDPRLLKEGAAATAEDSAKICWLADNVPEMLEEGRRILIFSQFTSMLALVERLVKEIHAPYALLTGDTKDRGAEVDKFQSGEATVFLLSLKAGGSGLNLTAADTVILLDPWWNPAAEAQAVDRAHRIGQERPVFVYRLIALGTVEERVAALQERKKDLIKGVMEGAPSAMQLTAVELRQLLSPLDR